MPAVRRCGDLGTWSTPPPRRYRGGKRQGWKFGAIYRRDILRQEFPTSPKNTRFSHKMKMIKKINTRKLCVLSNLTGLATPCHAMPPIAPQVSPAPGMQTLTRRGKSLPQLAAFFSFPEVNYRRGLEIGQMLTVYTCRELLERRSEHAGRFG